MKRISRFGFLAPALMLGGMALVGLGRTPMSGAEAPNTVTLDIVDAPLEDALSTIETALGRPVEVAAGSVARARMVTVKLHGRSAEEAARAIARAGGVPLTVSAESIQVGRAPRQSDGTSFDAPELETSFFGQNRFLPGAPAGLRVVTRRHGDGSPVPNAQIHISSTRAAKPGEPGTPGLVRPLAKGRTGADGTLNAVFRMPELPGGSYTLSVVAEALGERDRLSSPVTLAPSAQVLLTTDKPIYQPGQTIHIRALALKSPDRAPLALTDAVIEVADAKGNKVFKRRARTSEYGIVSADMELADEINLGAWKVTCTAGPAVQEKTVNVERYVLPKFKVELSPDNPWYRPGSMLTGSVSAQYFFGKPVAGRVEISLSTFDAGFNEFAKVSGTLDATGHLRFSQKLPDFFAGQPLEQGNAFVKADVVVTDTANHPEKASASVPVAASGLKVTVVPESPSALLNAPNRAYVVTSRPDGRPAAAPFTATLASGRAIRGNTDASGVGMVEYVPISADETLSVSARDGDGNQGQATVSLSGTEDAILLRADQALYRVGDRLALTARTTSGRSTLYFDIVRDGQTVLTKSVPASGGTSVIHVDLTADLSGTLEIHAWRLSRDGNIRRDTRVVYVDPANDLTVTAAPDKDSYLPGEPAKVRFTVKGPDGAPRPAALGVSIVDESVFALQDMQPGLEKVYFLLEKEILEPRYEIHGITPGEIVRPMSTPAVEPRRQRAAGALFASIPRHDGRIVMLDNSFPRKSQELQRRAFRLMLASAEKVRQALKRYGEARGRLPGLSGDPLVLLVRERFLDASDARDAWRKPYSVAAVSASFADGFRFTSSGPDGKPGTEDDLNIYVSLDQPVREDDFGFGDHPILVGGAFRGRFQEWDMLGIPAAPAMIEERMAFDRLARGETVVTKTTNGAAAGAPDAPVRVREYFPETLLFQPSLITNNQGVAVLDVPMADSITTWRLSATASSRTGALGSVTAPMKAFQDFFVDINFPVRLTQGDEVAVPVSVYNYLPAPQTVTLTADREGWFQLLDDAEKTVTLGPNEVKGVRYRIRATGLGFQKLTIRAKGTSRADAVRREVEIIPNGRRVEQALNGSLAETVRQTVEIPAGSVAGASNILVKVYPGMFSTVVEGMDQVFRMPFGCFEQTSSVTYPNVLVLDYLKRTERAAPEIQMKAEQYINLGLQRLVSYEVEGGGFSWFGNAPANKVLTAYGLMEFADMSNVWDVDPAMVSRTRAWLAGQQNADGSWTPDPNYIDEGLGPMWKSNFLSTAYIGWGMAESARVASDSDAASTQKALAFLKNHAMDAADPYALAVLANALNAMAPKDPAVRDTLDRLLALKTDEGDKTWWKTGQATVTFAGGDSADIETTALVCYALIRSGHAPDVATRAMNWLVSKKDAGGTWGSTQATILTLKAMVAATEAMTAPSDATIRVMVNGSEAGLVRVTPENSDVLQQVDAKAYVRPGANDIELVVSGSGRLMYGITSWHYLPWTNAAEREGPLTVKVAYDRTRLAQDETLTADVSVTFNPAAVPTLGNRSAVPPRAANMVVVDLGIPPGFQVDAAGVEALVAEKTVDRYELTGRQVILYFERIEAARPLSFKVRMKALYPLRALTPRSVAYQYYEPEVRSIAEPVSLEVTE